MATKKLVISRGGLYTLCVKRETLNGYSVLKLFPLWENTLAVYNATKKLTDLCKAYARMYEDAYALPRASKCTKAMYQVYSSIMNGEWVGIQLSSSIFSYGVTHRSHCVGLATSNRKMIELLKKERGHVSKAEIVRVDGLYKQDLMGIETTTTKEFLL